MATDQPDKVRIHPTNGGDPKAGFYVTRSAANGQVRATSEVYGRFRDAQRCAEGLCREAVIADGGVAVPAKQRWWKRKGPGTAK